jgi:hypothetical protein
MLGAQGNAYCIGLFQHKTTSDIVFAYFWIKKWDFSLGPISGLIDPPPFSFSVY